MKWKTCILDILTGLDHLQLIIATEKAIIFSV